MKVMTKWIVLTSLAAAAIGIAFGWIGVAIQIGMQVSLVAYTIGRIHERRRCERELTRASLEAFAEFAEGLLSHDRIDELDDDAREQLQGEYQRAQNLLRQLR